MDFWALEIAPKKTVTFTPPKGSLLNVSQATLIVKGNDKGDAHLVQCATTGKSYAICSLRAKIAENCPLALTFSGGTKVTFKGSSAHTITLSGHMHPVEEEGEESSSEEEQEVVEPVKKRKADNQVEQQQPKSAKKAKVEKVQEAPKATETPKKKKKPKVVSLKNGLKYRDLKEGSGKAAKNGMNISVRYRGLLKNGIEFDSNLPKGRPFSFQLGAREVVRGWDLGLVGMKVGGVRELVIPSQLGYGQAGAGNKIPPNATLLFEVHLLKAK